MSETDKSETPAPKKEKTQAEELAEIAAMENEARSIGRAKRKKLLERQLKSFGPAMAESGFNKHLWEPKEVLQMFVDAVKKKNAESGKSANGVDHGSRENANASSAG